jgi:hypothetical protein
MNHTETDRVTKATTLRNGLLEDAQSLTNDEVREEIIAAGENPDELGEKLQAMTLNLVAQARKTRLAEAKRELSRQTRPEQSIVQRSVEAIRRRLSALAIKPESLAGKKIALAFRNGSEQSDGDVLSLWQDLVDLGAVSDDELTD